jgi:hypothetical protein
MTEEGSTRIDEVLEKWTPPPLRDREREIFVNKQNLLESCKELRKLYLKSIETSDFIRYWYMHGYLCWLELDLKLQRLPREGVLSLGVEGSSKKFGLE